LPADFHRAAAEIFRRLGQFKDGAAPGLNDVLGTLLK
jgi:hypothetical protein